LGPYRERERRRMRKLTLMLVLVVVMVPLGAVAALAHDQLIQCRAIPCYGSGNDDKILERIGNGKADKIITRGAHDLILANKYTRDIDVVKSGRGFDKIKVNDGDTLDTAGAGRGTNDWCFVDSRAEVGPGCDRVTRR
jgi:hypothetical protein